jgi:hypothetical protein
MCFKTQICADCSTPVLSFSDTIPGMPSNPLPPELLKPPYSTEALRDLADKIGQLADEMVLERWRRGRERATNTPDAARSDRPAD